MENVVKYRKENCGLGELPEKKNREMMRGTR